MFAQTLWSAFRRRWRWVWLTPLLLVAAAALVRQFTLQRREHSLHERVFRVGYQDVPPVQFRGGDGQAAGVSIDIFNEAARHRGIRLEWVWAPEGPEPNLRSGAVDLWTEMGDLP